MLRRIKLHLKICNSLATMHLPVSSFEIPGIARDGKLWKANRHVDMKKLTPAEGGGRTWKLEQFSNSSVHESIYLFVLSLFQ
jgi:hypothetical protein